MLMGHFLGKKNIDCPVKKGVGTAPLSCQEGQAPEGSVLATGTESRGRGCGAEAGSW